VITEEESLAFDIIITATVNANNDLKRVIAARDSYVKLLEDKYKAVFKDGKFQPKKVKKVKVIDQ
tara:strand:+ start:219 stop:413 length:195 start_codon:yes stop_codon:yes gene_type:complete